MMMSFIEEWVHLVTSHACHTELLNCKHIGLIRSPFWPLHKPYSFQVKGDSFPPPPPQRLVAPLFSCHWKVSAFQVECHCQPGAVLSCTWLTYNSHHLPGTLHLPCCEFGTLGIFHTYVQGWLLMSLKLRYRSSFIILLPVNTTLGGAPGRKEALKASSQYSRRIPLWTHSDPSGSRCNKYQSCANPAHLGCKNCDGILTLLTVNVSLVAYTSCWCNPPFLAWGLFSSPQLREPWR